MYEWYYVGQFGQLGPLSLEQMKELVDSQVVLADTYVWKTGMTDWVRATSIPEFVPLMASAGPPPFRSEPALVGVNSRAMDPALISPHNRNVAGILNLFLPGIGRMYLGYLAIGILQFILAFMSCGVLAIWSFIDGILILTGNVPLDGYGRALKE